MNILEFFMAVALVVLFINIILAIIEIYNLHCEIKRLKKLRDSYKEFVKLFEGERK